MKKRDKVKKPIYKSWWFWVLSVFMAFVVLIIITPTPDDAVGTVTTTAPPTKALAGTSKSNQTTTIRTNTTAGTTDKETATEADAHTEPTATEQTTGSLATTKKQETTTKRKVTTTKKQVATTKKLVTTTKRTGDSRTVVINIKTKVYHIDPSCSAVKRMNAENKGSATLETAKNQGYQACGTCSK